MECRIIYIPGSLDQYTTRLDTTLHVQKDKRQLPLICLLIKDYNLDYSSRAFPEIATRKSMYGRLN